MQIPEIHEIYKRIYMNIYTYIYESIKELEQNINDK